MILGALVSAFGANASAGDEWMFHPSPSPGNLTNILYGVDGVAGNDVWAVGRADFGPGYPEPPDQYRTLAMHWDGKSWSHVPTPDPGAYWNDLLEVVAFGPDEVWAAGNGSASALSQVLVLRWDGDGWSIVPTPLAAGGAAAWSMDGLSQEDLWVVGQGDGPGAFAWHWNGSSWNQTAVPVVGTVLTALYGADMLASNDVWAVGRYRNSGGTSRFVIMHWTGSAWSIAIESFTSSTVHSSLRGVAAIAPDDIWAVGDQFTSGAATQPLLMHFDGGAWTEYPLPIFPDGATELRDVTALGPADVWAAGTRATDEGIPRPLIMHYDGGEWSVVSDVVSGGSHEWFRDIAVIPGGDVWAVGQFSPGGAGTTTLTMQRPAVQPIPGDVTGDGIVNISDLLAVLAAWGPCIECDTSECPADVTGDCVVGIGDLLAVLVHWS